MRQCCDRGLEQWMKKCTKNSADDLCVAWKFCKAYWTMASYSPPHGFSWLVPAKPSRSASQIVNTKNPSVPCYTRFIRRWARRLGTLAIIDVNTSVINTIRSKSMNNVRLSLAMYKQMYVVVNALLRTFCYCQFLSCNRVYVYVFISFSICYISWVWFDFGCYDHAVYKQSGMHRFYWVTGCIHQVLVVYLPWKWQKWEIGRFEALGHSVMISI